MKNDSVIVFGAGSFGASVAENLFKYGIEVMIVDRDMDLIQDISTKVNIAIRCDVMDDEALNELGVSNFDVAVIAIGSNLEASIVATLYCKEQGVKKIIAKGTNEKQMKLLKKVGADIVIFPEQEIGANLARSISGENIFEYIHFSDEYSIVEIGVRNAWVGMTIKELDFRNAYNLNIIAIRRGGHLEITPSADYRMEQKDRIVIIGEDVFIDKLEKDAQ